MKFNLKTNILLILLYISIRSISFGGSLDSSQLKSIAETTSIQEVEAWLNNFTDVENQIDAIYEVYRVGDCKVAAEIYQYLETKKTHLYKELKYDAYAKKIEISYIENQIKKYYPELYYQRITHFSTADHLLKSPQLVSQQESVFSQNKVEIAFDITLLRDGLKNYSSKISEISKNLLNKYEEELTKVRNTILELEKNNNISALEYSCQKFPGLRYVLNRDREFLKSLRPTFDQIKAMRPTFDDLVQRHQNERSFETQLQRAKERRDFKKISEHQNKIRSFEYARQEAQRKRNLNRKLNTRIAANKNTDFRDSTGEKFLVFQDPATAKQLMSSIAEKIANDLRVISKEIDDPVIQYGVLLNLHEIAKDDPTVARALEVSGINPTESEKEYHQNLIYSSVDKLLIANGVPSQHVLKIHEEIVKQIPPMIEHLHELKKKEDQKYFKLGMVFARAALFASLNTIYPGIGSVASNLICDLIESGMTGDKFDIETSIKKGIVSAASSCVGDVVGGSVNDICQNYSSTDFQNSFEIAKDVFTAVSKSASENFSRQILETGEINLESIAQSIGRSATQSLLNVKYINELDLSETEETFYNFSLNSLNDFISSDSIDEFNNAMAERIGSHVGKYMAENYSSKTDSNTESNLVATNESDEITQQLASESSQALKEDGSLSQPTRESNNNVSHSQKVSENLPWWTFLLDPDLDMHIRHAEKISIENNEDFACFIPSTQVLTSHGSVEIQDLVPGDKIISCSHDMSCVERKVEATRRLKDRHIIRFVTEAGSFDLTPDHRLLRFLEDGYEYVEAQDFQSGDYLRSLNGEKVKFLRIIDLHKTSDVIDIQVEETKNFFVIDPCLTQSKNIFTSGIQAHNCSFQKTVLKEAQIESEAAREGFQIVSDIYSIADPLFWAEKAEVILPSGDFKDHYHYVVEAAGNVRNLLLIPKAMVKGGKFLAKQFEKSKIKKIEIPEGRYKDSLKNTGNSNSHPKVAKEWKITNPDKTVYHNKFKNIHYDAKTDTWWSKDTAGHGGSSWKIFKETKKGLEWFKDADKYGTFLDGKHKGDVGKFIPWKELKVVK